MMNLCNKFKQRVPIALCDIDGELRKSCESSDDFQPQLLKTLIDISNYNPYYSNMALKKIIDHLERANIEINEEYYEYLMIWLSSRELKPTDQDVISYPLGQEMFTSIKESPNLISGLGTTGLRTWEASLFLTDYIMNHMSRELYDECFRDQSILELGCGTGFVGISLLKHLNDDIEKMALTDGDSQLIDKIGANLILNGIDLEHSKLEVCKLWWGEDSIKGGVKTVVAADVTYDSSIIPSLVQTIKDGMINEDVKHVFLGATVRNTETLSVWETALRDNEQVWDWNIATTRIQGQEEGEQLYYPPHTAPIHVYHVTRRL